jgi:sterol desaturase/sphingolipid hydroxylase (fatty acid hydroxylase superfamily)
MINLFLGILALLLMVLLELCYLHFVEKQAIPWREIIFNLNSGHVMTWVCRGIEITGFDFVLRHASIGLVSSWHLAAQWIFTLFAWDFCFYWMHRLHHKYPLLWAVHVVHHEGEHFSLSLGIRNSWYSSLTSLPFFIPMAILGVSTEQFVLMGAFHYFVQFYNHNRIVNKSGWLEYFIVTPSHHRVHHGCNPEYRDKNCGGTFAMWDMWFGTFQPERDDIQIQYGVKHKSNTINPFWANHIPFMKYVFKSKVPDFQSFERNQKILNDFILSIGGILQFGLLIFYIYQEDKWGGWREFLLFDLLLMSTIALAGLYENYRWGTDAYLLVSILLFGFMLYFGIEHWVFVLLNTLMLIHALGVFIYLRLR